MLISSISPSEFCRKQFDYLIIGGGTAGLVVAARLSEHANIKVGVLEAGPAVFDDRSINTPGRFGESIGGQHDWQFMTTSQAGLNGRTLPWPRGKVLGGSSAINFMAWNRGNRQDYDAWEKLGNRGWGWDGLLPFFKKTESLTEPDEHHSIQHKCQHNPDYHGKNGPVRTVYSAEFSVPHQHWHATLENLGLKTNTSHFSGSNLGAWTTLTSVDPETRTRCSSATSYFLPNASRENLSVLTDALAQEILLEKVGKDWAARGVRFFYDNEEFTVQVSGEIIVSAGSIQSPQLLELSGIGDPSILQAAGVQVKVPNSNVGQNLQDHMMTAAVYEIDQSIIGPDDLRTDPILAEAADHAYESSRTGIRAMLPCALSYASLSQILPAHQIASFQSRIQASSLSPRDRVLAGQLSTDIQRGQVEFLFDVGNWSPYFKSEAGKKYGTMLQMLQLPFSKGSIHIRSNSIEDHPVIDPQYYTGPGGEVDFEIMSRAQAFADKICRTAPLSSIVQTRAFPFPVSTSSSTDQGEEFSSWVRDNTITDWHPIGTCAMGGDAGIGAGVVDDRLRVYSVKRLRVADASIMPLHICSHPQATIYAIGEKAAAMILEDRLKESQAPNKMSSAASSI